MSELSRRVSGDGQPGGRSPLGAVAGAAAENPTGRPGTQGEGGGAADLPVRDGGEPGHDTDGGSAKQATIKELPVSKGLAGVSMRLNPGGIRELHWHAIAAEWAFVIKAESGPR